MIVVNTLMEFNKGSTCGSCKQENVSYHDIDKFKGIIGDFSCTDNLYVCLLVCRVVIILRGGASWKAHACEIRAGLRRFIGRKWLGVEELC